MKTEALPVLAIKNNALFPTQLMPIAVGRPVSVAGVEAALASEDKELLVVAQRDPTVEAPKPSDVFSIGTKALIKKAARAQPGLIELVVHGIERVDIVEFMQEQPFLRARVLLAPLVNEQTPEVEALHREVMDHLETVLALAGPRGPIHLEQLASSLSDPVRLLYVIGPVLSLDVSKEQALLEAKTVTQGLRLLHSHLAQEAEILKLRREIAGQARSEISKEQREYYLRQQLRAIRDELGESDPTEAEIGILRERIEEADLPDEVRTELSRELTRLERLPPAAPDYNVTRTYLELALELPWRRSTEEKLDMGRARSVLNEDHHDLEEVKERILEHLAVLKLNPQAKSPILCFVGPPGGRFQGSCRLS